MIIINNNNKHAYVGTRQNSLFYTSTVFTTAILCLELLNVTSYHIYYYSRIIRHVPAAEDCAISEAPITSDQTTCSRVTKLSSDVRALNTKPYIGRICLHVFYAMAAGYSFLPAAQRGDKHLRLFFK